MEIIEEMEIIRTMILKREVVIRIRGILGNGTIIDDFIFVGIDMVGIERGGIVEEGEMKR